MLKHNKHTSVAYPELVSRGVSKSHKFKGLVKVDASKGVIRVDLKKSRPGGGCFRATRKPSWIRHCTYIHTYITHTHTHGRVNIRKSSP